MYKMQKQYFHKYQQIVLDTVLTYKSMIETIYLAVHKYKYRNLNSVCAVEKRV